MTNIIVLPTKTTEELTARDLRIQERAPTVAAIKHVYKMRQDMLRTQTSLTNQIKSICRRAANDGVRTYEEIKAKGKVIYERITKKKFKFDDLSPNEKLVLETAMYLLQSREVLTPKINECEKTLTGLAETFTQMADLIEGTRGLTFMSIAVVVGEAGDLENYSNPAKLWKRCGVAVINGEAQRRVAGTSKAAKIKAVDFGYNPVRRSAVWNIVSSLLKEDNIYKPIYDEKKAKYYQTHTHLLEYTKSGKLKSGAMHLHNMAARYTTKVLLKHIWQVWRKEEISDGYIKQEPELLAA